MNDGYLSMERRTGQTIDIDLGDGRYITIYAGKIRGNRIRIGVDAPRELPIKRGELNWSDIKRPTN